MIQASWLRLFNPREFNQLLSGGDVEVDVVDLRSHVKYSGCVKAAPIPKF